MSNKHSKLEIVTDFFVKEGYSVLTFFVVFLLIFTYPLPYYVFVSGGITDLSDRFEIEGGYTQKGSYNLSYVNELEGTVFSYLASFVMPGWQSTETSNYQVSDKETLEELAIRDRISLYFANQTATFIAYEKANKTINRKSVDYYVYSMYSILESDKKIKIGDILKSVDNVKINDFNQVTEIISAKNDGDTVLYEFERNGKTYQTNAKVHDLDGNKLTGITFYALYDYEVEPKITHTFGAKEGGGSAGLMTTLAIYDTLIEEDLTHGLKIAGTGVINPDGTVGPIGGVEYKLAGAVKGDADIFLVPSGENYEDAMKAKKKHDYDIEIVEIHDFDKAINYLKNYKS
jgi:PDZ domain-containing protein